MKKFLLITISFPPMHGAGIFRPSRLAKYLPQYSWVPIVLTMRASRSENAIGEPSQLYAHIVFRTPSFDPTLLYAKLKKIYHYIDKKFIKIVKEKKEGIYIKKNVTGRFADKIFVPDIRVFWIPGALVTGIISIILHAPAVLYSTSPSPHLVACALSLLFRKPWVAEFRDPWITNPFRKPRSIDLIERLDCKLEEIVVNKARHIIVTSLKYKKDFLQRYTEIAEDKISFIPNGFDPADFEDIEPQHFDKPAIVHVGNFYEARSSLTFLKALSAVLNNSPELRSKFQVIFVGNLDNLGSKYVASENLADIIVQKGQQPHKEALRLMCGAAALLLIPGPGDGTMPGKTFEYIRAQKPIFCLADEGPAKELIEEAGIGMIVKSNDVEIVAKSLCLFLNQLLSNSYIYPDISAMIKQFDRREIARQTSEVFKRISIGDS